jgi:hypothetical protein
LGDSPTLKGPSDAEGVAAFEACGAGFDFNTAIAITDNKRLMATVGAVTIMMLKLGTGGEAKTVKKQKMILPAVAQFNHKFHRKAH